MLALKMKQSLLALISLSALLTSALLRQMLLTPLFVSLLIGFNHT